MGQFDDVSDVRILVVDDYQLTRDMVRLILKGIGFQNVTVAEGGKEALLLLRERPFDLVVCDWNMPSMSGLELLQKIRSDEVYRNLPFLMLTAEAYRENIVAAMNAGVDDYIAKPFNSETLAQKVESVLRKRKKKKG